jgi:hypothetical protein
VLEAAVARASRRDTIDVRARWELWHMAKDHVLELGKFKFKVGSGSLTLETNDGYFKKPTVVYVKGKPEEHPGAVNVIVWFHGFYVSSRDEIFNDEQVGLLKALEGCPKKEIVLIAPWLGNVFTEYKLDSSGAKIPRTNKEGDIIVDGKGNIEYERQVNEQSRKDYVAQEEDMEKSGDEYVKNVLEGLANFLGANGRPLKGADKFTIKNLIVACHSGGGRAMRSFVTGQPKNGPLKESWCFDCLYQDPTFWFTRAVDKDSPLPFYTYYFDTKSNTQALLKLMGHEKDKEFSQDGSSLNVVDNTSKSHYRTASEGFPDRLSKTRNLD